VAVIDAATNTVTATIPVGGSRPEAFGIFIPGPAGVPFAAFSPRASIYSKAGALSVHGGFALRAGRTINPATDKVTVRVGAFSVTIPAGSFQQRKNGDFVFKGMIMGIPLEARISPRGDGSYSFKIEGAGAPNLPTTSPFPVGLTIGNDTGSTTVNTNFGDEGNWQTRGDN